MSILTELSSHGQMKPKLTTRKENISMNTCKQNKPETFGTETIPKTLKSVNFYQQFFYFILGNLNE